MSPTFIVDNNVGKLARWLRALGYDTLWINPIEDDDLVEIARREGRVILTKDRGVLARRLVASGEVRALFVEGERIGEQLRHVVTALHLDYRSRRFSRCLECNDPLVPISREEVKDRVPPYVYQTQTQFTACPRCGRVYWRGTHWDRMRREIDRLLEGT